MLTALVEPYMKHKDDLSAVEYLARSFPTSPPPHAPAERIADDGRQKCIFLVIVGF